MMFEKRRFVAVSLFAFLLLPLVAQSELAAQNIPFRINGDGLILGDILVAPGGSAMHSSTGRGTAGLGRYVGIGQVFIESVDLATGMGTFSSAVPYHFMKLGNGDTLAFQYGRTDDASGASPPAQDPGVVMVLPVGDQGMVMAVWWAEFNPVPAESTGQFADVASGSFFMLAETEPFFFGATGDGIPFIPEGTAYTWSGMGMIHFD